MESRRRGNDLPSSGHFSGSFYAFFAFYAVTLRTTPEGWQNASHDE
jgi:hypothetical protein